MRTSRWVLPLVALCLVLSAGAIVAVRLPSGAATAWASGVGFLAIVAVPLALNRYLARRRRRPQG